MAGAQHHGAHLGLARLDAIRRHLDAVVRAVADEVDHGVAQLFDDALIDFRVLTGHVQVDLLAAGLGQVAEHARELGEDGLHGHHADTQHRGLNLLAHMIQVDRGMGQFLGHAGSLMAVHHGHKALDQVADHGLADDQLGHDVHELFQLGLAHADGVRGALVIGPAAAGLAAVLHRRCGLGGRRCAQGQGVEADGGIGDGAKDLADLLHGLRGLDDHHEVQVEGFGIERIQLHAGFPGDHLLVQQAPHQLHHLEHGEGVEGGTVDGAGQLGLDADDALALGLAAGLVHAGQGRGQVQLPLGRRSSCGRLGGSAHLEGFEVADQLAGIGIGQLTLLAHLHAHVLHEDLEHVHGLEEQLHDAVAELHAPLAEVVQDVLADVGHGLDLRQPQEAGGPLDGMHTAEDGVQQIQVPGRFFQRQEVGLDLLEVLLRLDEEIFVEAGIIEGEFAHASPVLLAVLRRPWRPCSCVVSVSVRSCFSSRRKIMPLSSRATLSM